MRKLLLLALLSGALAARAEIWAPLEDYVHMCSAIVKAKVVSMHDHRVALEITEVWAGSVGKIAVDDLGRYDCYDGEHGMRVRRGQEVVLFFTGEKKPHSTSFPIEDGRLIYGATSDSEYREFAEDEFRDEILRIIAAAARTK